jgi:putative membrane protein
MIVSAIFSALHLIGLGIGLGAIFVRGRVMRAIAAGQSTNMRAMFVADIFWGMAAVIWLVTGLARAFAGLEKGTDYYLHNPMFHLKITLFILLVLLEMKPMIQLTKWRAKVRSTPGFVPTQEDLQPLMRLNFIELHIVAIIPFVAAFMARGFGS